MHYREPADLHEPLGFGRKATPSPQTLSSSRTGPESRTVPGRSAPQ